MRGTIRSSGVRPPSGAGRWYQPTEPGALRAWCQAWLSHQLQRIPAPRVSAKDASIISASVKRARFAFTDYSFRAASASSAAGSWAVLRSNRSTRSLALRPTPRDGFALGSGATEKLSSLTFDASRHIRRAIWPDRTFGTTDQGPLFVGTTLIQRRRIG